MENYSIKTVCLSLTLMITSYLLGTLILIIFNPLLGLFYLFLCIITLLCSMKLRCTHCFYYGKRCYSGLGVLSKIFFSKGDSEEFTNPKKVFPIAILSFSILLLPILIGIFLIINNLSIQIFILLFIYILVGILPNFFLREKLCEKCEQGKLGCPAYNKMRKQKKKKEV